VEFALAQLLFEPVALEGHFDADGEVAVAERPGEAPGGAGRRRSRDRPWISASGHKHHRDVEPLDLGRRFGAIELAFEAGIHQDKIGAPTPRRLDCPTSGLLNPDDVEPQLAQARVKFRRNHGLIFDNEDSSGERSTGRRHAETPTRRDAILKTSDG